MQVLGNRKIVEIIRFCIVGGCTFILDYSLLYCLTEYVGLCYLFSSAIAFVVAVIVNYVLCYFYVFDNAKNGLIQIALFVLTSIVGLGLNQLCMWGFVEKIGLHYLIAKIGATGIVTIWNYVTKKKALEL